MKSHRRKIVRRPSILAKAEALESRRMLSANVVISEFMASNSKTLQDAAGDYPDWVEIHNAGDADANLSDYYLTDSAGDPEKWRFPAQTLSAGAYLKVFADGTNVAVAGQELHTNFSLGADGEYLGLRRAADDSVQFEYAPTFPAQTADISYGLADANNPGSARVFFNYPTPGAANTPNVAIPTVSAAGQVFTGTLSVTLTLTDATPGAKIYYTTDGSVPTTGGTGHAGSVTLSLSASTMLRVIGATTVAGYLSSPVTSQTYERVDGTVTGVQNANLPVVIIDTLGATINDTTNVAAQATIVNTAAGGTNVLGAADYQGRIGIHIRGSTSEKYPKQQYSIELWDEANQDKKAPLLGMAADSDWVLYAPYTETTLMQNQLAYLWGSETGNYTTKTQYVEVYMSTAGDAYAANTTTINYASNYLGVFILIEKIKVDANRVDVDEMSATNPNGGFIVAQDRTAGTTNFTSSKGVSIIQTDPEDASLTSNIAGKWNQFESALFDGSATAGQAWDTPGNPSYYGNFIDVKSWVDYWLVNEMTKNIDSFWLSTYYTVAPTTVVNGVTQRGLISAGPIWDFNLALGAADYNNSANSAGWDTDTLSPLGPGIAGWGPQDLYFQRLLMDPNFQQAIVDRWSQLRSGVFSTTKMMGDIDASVSLLSDGTGVYPVGTNPTGVTSPVMRNFQKWKMLGTGVTTQGMFDPAGSWIQDVNLMKNWLTGRLNWMDSAVYAMTDVPSGLTTSTQTVPAPLVSPGGNFSGPTTVTMTPKGAAVLTDTPLIGSTASVKYLVPTAATAPTSAWTTVGYAATGWTTGTNGIGYDTTTTGAGAISFLPYINTNVQTAMRNNASSLYVRITFTVSNPAAIQALILKAYYDDGFIAYVNGVRVMDANSKENLINPVYNSISGGSGVDALAITNREFDITSIKSLLVAGTNVLAIQGLNSGSGSEDFLLAPTLYTRAYTYPTAGTVWYTTDGSDPRLVQTSAATPGHSATAVAYAGALTLSTGTEIKARTLANGVWGALSDQVYVFDATSVRITEMMYNPPALAGYATQDLEYVELKNVSAAPVSLNGYSFTNGIVFTFPNVTLAAGAYGVVVKNPAAFAARYGTSANVIGTYTGSLDNSGETVELSNGFGQAVETFKYQPTWYASTNGGGTALVAVDPSASNAVLATAAGWRASFAADGAPGFADTDAVAPVVTSWSVNDGGAGGQPSVTFNFAGYVSAGSAGTFTVTDVVTGAAIAVTGRVFDGTTATFSFAASLASGAYAFSLPAGAVVNASNIGTVAGTAATFVLVRAGGVWSVPASGPGIVAQRLVIGSGGAIDLAAGALVLDYSGVTMADAVRQLLLSGRAGGAWNGSGIRSSTAAANANHGIAYVEASDLGMTSFGGTAVDGSAILLTYTWTGDANADGRLTGDDFALADRGLAKGLSGWVMGDFDYDGVVTGGDVTLLDQAYGAVNAPPAAATVVVLPVVVAEVSAPVVVVAAPVVAAPVVVTELADEPVVVRPVAVVKKPVAKPVPAKKKVAPAPKKPVKKPAVKVVKKPVVKAKVAVAKKPVVFMAGLFSSVAILMRG